MTFLPKTGLRSLAAAAALATAIGALPASAQSFFVAFNNLTVVGDRQAPGAMEVLWKQRTGPTDFWCAAGDFARSRLGASLTDRVYLLRGSGQSQLVANRRATAFTIVPEPGFENAPRGGQGGAISLSVTEPGYSLTVAHARAFCNDSRQRRRGIGLF